MAEERLRAPERGQRRGVQKGFNNVLMFVDHSVLPYTVTSSVVV